MDERVNFPKFDDETLVSWDEIFEEKPADSNAENLDVFSKDFAISMPDKFFEPVEKDQKYWENLFNEMNFPGMDLMAVSYFPNPQQDLIELHQQFKRVSRDFVRLVSYNYITDLRAAGISEEGIFYMKKGKLPENFTVHLKYPLEYGGTLDFTNMVLIQDKPFHDLIHAYMDRQILTPSGLNFPQLLYVPVPVGKVYIPFSLLTGSGGKNKQDRSVFAGFSKAAFEKIALKSMPGR